MANNFEIKEKIVRNGDSKVFKNWQENSNITMEDFLDGLRWLCDDPMTDGKLTRELGCIRRADSGWSDKDREILNPIEPHNPGVDRIYRLTRVYWQDGSFRGFVDETGHTWGGSTECASISARDRI